VLYLLQIDPPLMRKSAPTRYYLGYCKDGRLDERLAEHQAGTGAALTRAAVKRGCTLTVVWTSKRGTRKDERKLKRQRNHKRLLASGK
jgi:putative endonuclease